ncbi:MAG: CoB--CoM heterodisulfide reductase iron-sulfur subunit A family protein, partial [Deltaproteobacteria bacterium]|nr:CoB--CoM heterodisulfide reductase iron-sulfur subunit A family protein [Deltaproteobacteria bacterium]
YIDTGYGIGEALDIEALKDVAKKKFKVVAVCRAEPYWNDPDKLAIIRNDIASEKLTTVVVAGPSPRVFQQEFTFPGVITERANLREHVVWSHPANDEDTQMLAEDYLRMWITKASKYDDRPPYIQEIERAILVIGGGITGMTAALEAAAAGYQVYLVEKEGRLGGWANNFHKVFTGKPPYDEIKDSPVHEKIKVFTGKRVFSVAGSPGMFDVTIRPDGPWIDKLVEEQNEWLAAKKAREAAGEEEPKPAKTSQQGQAQAEVEEVPEEKDFEHEVVRVGAVVLAAGWRPEDPSELENFGYGTYPNVISSVEMEELAAKGNIVRPSDGRPVNSIAFIECIDGKKERPLLYSSSVSSLVALKQAHYLRQTNPDGKAYIFYENMRTPGQYEKFYQTMQNDPGVFL